MTIKTDSWHYGWYIYFLREAGVEIKTPNLCKYFWSVVIGAPGIWVLLRVVKMTERVGRMFNRIPAGPRIPETVVSAMGWLILAIVVAAAIAGIAALGVIIYLFPMHSLVVTAIVGGAIIALLLVLAIIAGIADWINGRPRKPSKPRKSLEVPGTAKLVWNFAWAKKERICPFITFEQVEEKYR